MRFSMLLSLVAGTAADCYLQVPPGSNNRLAEGGGNRNNNNRLMDTQNNAKGGYGYGGDAGNKAAPLKYMTGSKLSTAWTSQHSCGSENNECQIVVQYMCNDAAAAGAGLPATGATGAGEGPIRDGTNGNTPNPDNANANTGLHEPASFYQACDARERNKGLYTADQNMNNNNGARATRQNPNGNRSGQECPEERDYYPYWHPSPWKDVAILTNNLALCEWYKQESQNVKAKNYCSDQQYNNEASCTGNGGTWEAVAPFGIAPPECVAAPFQRDNHLGNGPTGHEVGFNWTIPDGAATNCVARFRYNITTADTRVCEDDSYKTRAECEANGKIWSAAYLDASYNNMVNGDNNAANGNVNPPLLEGNPDVNMDGFLEDTGDTNSLLELAINTNQYGRTFQDRTHVFEVQERPLAVGSATPIYNLNVRGKRGNIVQTYPATEYDFHPSSLVVGANDIVNIQWTGNDNTNNNGGNNGEGVDDEDRHNIVQLPDDNSGLSTPLAGSQNSMFDLEWEWNPEPATSEFGGSRDKDELTKQAALVKQTGCLTEGQINNDQQRQNCQKLNAAAATVDLGLMKFKPGTYKYMSSRNNNFSNRAQKASISVSSNLGNLPEPPVNVQAEVVSGGGSAKSVYVTWAAPGNKDPVMGTDKQPYWNMEQQLVTASDYYVSYSIDGGETWIAGPNECAGQGRSCTIKDLPAGTTTLVQVQAGSAAGWGVASEPAAVQTESTSSSDECASMLRKQADGSWTSPGTIVAIVFGVVAALLLVGAAVFVMKRRQPPPPPPGGKPAY